MLLMLITYICYVEAPSTVAGGQLIGDLAIEAVISVSCCDDAEYLSYVSVVVILTDVHVVDRPAEDRVIVIGINQGHKHTRLKSTNICIIDKKYMYLVW